MGKEGIEGNKSRLVWNELEMNFSIITGSRSVSQDGGFSTS